MIKSFRGQYRWLSNFYYEWFLWDSMEYPTAEHAYQSAKATNTADADYVTLAGTPGEAKRRGRRIKMDPTFEGRRIEVMRSIIAAKFPNGGELSEKLIDTEDEELVEGNAWGDHFWGVSGGLGANHLGVLLMERREELQRWEDQSGDLP